MNILTDIGHAAESALGRAAIAVSGAVQAVAGALASPDPESEEGDGS